jgi:hypothetical protein
MHYDRITTTIEREWLSESSRARRRSSSARSSLTGLNGSRRVVNEPSSGHCLGIAPEDGGWSNSVAICHPAEIGKPRRQTSNFSGIPISSQNQSVVLGSESPTTEPVYFPNTVFSTLRSSQNQALTSKFALYSHTIIASGCLTANIKDIDPRWR